MTAAGHPNGPGEPPDPHTAADSALPDLQQAARHPGILELLQTVSTMTLSTAAPGGQPHAAPVYFAASPHFDLYFFSAGDSLHSRALQGDPRAAAAIYPLCRGWQDIRGLQCHGTVALVES
ncbi:MAG: pyridoxamine 5'-phosphate oxidase family protein, partial [Anaerolineae bacterium]